MLQVSARQVEKIGFLALLEVLVSISGAKIGFFLLLFCCFFFFLLPLSHPGYQIRSVVIYGKEKRGIRHSLGGEGFAERS